MSRPKSRSFAMALLALALPLGAARAQQDPAFTAFFDGEPELLLAPQEDGSVSFELVAGAPHVGHLAFIVLSAAGDPQEALAEGRVLEARVIGIEGVVRGVLPLSTASGQVDLSHVNGVLMDRSGRLSAVTSMAGGPQGGGSLAIQIQPGGPPICMVPSPPPCTGGQLPDLIVSNIKIQTVQTSTACGPLLPRVNCGAVGFNATATIKNVGTCAIRCNTNISLRWGNGPPGNILFDATSQVVPSSDILPGGTMTITRHYYLGPCVGGFQQTEHFTAIVDSLGTIAESNEGNNQATPVVTCHHF